MSAALWTTGDDSLLRLDFFVEDGVGSMERERRVSHTIWLFRQLSICRQLQENQVKL